MWADVLIEHLQVPGIASSPLAEENFEFLIPECFQERDIVVVAIGGGHYVPKMNDAVSNSRYQLLLSPKLNIRINALKGKIR